LARFCCGLPSADELHAELDTKDVPLKSKMETLIKNIALFRV
jgi:hypothetical protein